MLIVEKYGGSSVSDINKIKEIALHLKREVNNNNKLIVVLSAMGKTTNNLLALANQITVTPNRREIDQLLITGEIVSVALAAIALHDLGVKTISLNAFQAGIIATGMHENGLIQSINKIKILEYLEEYDVVFITGFQGIDENDDFLTLGRGGSDTSAVAIAAVMMAKCRIYTDVNGIYAIDPGLVPSSKKYDAISCDLMMEMASLGSGVLITRSVVLANEYQVDLTLLKSLSKEGTKVVKTEVVEKIEVAALAVNKNIVLIEVEAFEEILFEILGKNGIKIDMINFNEGIIKFIIAEKDLNLFIKMMPENSFKYHKSISKISLIGNGISSRGNNLTKLLSCLQQIGIYPKNITTSELAISFIIDDENIAKVTHTVGEKFDLLNE